MRLRIGRRVAGRELAIDDPPELSEEASADVGLEEVEHRARLFRLVDELPADQRRVIAMRFAEEKSILEIAGALGRTEGAVKQLQFRGLQNLRAKSKAGNHKRHPSAPLRAGSVPRRGTRSRVAKMPRRSLIEQLDEALQLVIGNPGAPLPRGDAGVNPLVRLAAELRDLPREDFKIRLKNELERSISMATTTAPITATRISAAPRLAFKDAAKAIEFYKKAFGASEIMRFDTGSGIPHAEIMIGDSVVMLCDEWPEGGRYSAETMGSSPVSMSIQVPDEDAFAERAVAAGAKLAGPIADQFYGYREGTLLDPFGYSWAVSTVKEEMSVEEMHRRFRAMTKAEAGEEAGREPDSARLPHGHAVPDCRERSRRCWTLPSRRSGPKRCFAP